MLVLLSHQNCVPWKPIPLRYPVVWWRSLQCGMLGPGRSPWSGNGHLRSRNANRMRWSSLPASDTPTKRTAAITGFPDVQLREGRWSWGFFVWKDFRQQVSLLSFYSNFLEKIQVNVGRVFPSMRGWKPWRIYFGQDPETFPSACQSSLSRALAFSGRLRITCAMGPSFNLEWLCQDTVSGTGCVGIPWVS